MTSLSSLDHKTRRIIDDFNELFTPGAKMKEVLKRVAKRNSTTIFYIKKIFRSELNIDLTNDMVNNYCHESEENKKKKSVITYATEILNEEKIK